MNRAEIIPGSGTVIDPDSDPEFDNREQYLRDQEKEQEADVLAGLREMEGAEGARWRIYRIGSDDPSLNGFLDEVGTVQLSAVWIRDKFGGGKYRVRGHLAGNGRIIAHRTIEIAGDAPRKSTVTVSQTGISAGLSLEELERRQDARDERRRKERNELLALIIPAVAPIAAALIGRQGPDLATLVTALKPAPPPDPLQMIAALKQLTPQVEANQPSAMDAAFKLIEKLRDMAPTEGGTSWLDVAKEAVRSLGPVVAPVLESAMARAQGSGATAVARSTAVPSAVPAALASSAAIAGSESIPANGEPPMFGMLALVPWLKSQLEMALQKAARGSDPGLIAERILDDLPEGVKPETLVQFIAREDWWQQLQRFDARVAQFPQWFAQMREAMLDEFSGSDRREQSSINRIQSELNTSPEMKVTQIDEPDRPSGEPPKLGL